MSVLMPPVPTPTPTPAPVSSLRPVAASRGHLCSPLHPPRLQRLTAPLSPLSHLDCLPLSLLHPLFLSPLDSLPPLIGDSVHSLLLPSPAPPHPLLLRSGPTFLVELYCLGPGVTAISAEVTPLSSLRSCTSRSPLLVEPRGPCLCQCHVPRCVTQHTYHPWASSACTSRP